MKKIIFSLLFLCLFSFASYSQLMVARLVGKDAAKYGFGYGLFAYLDVPLSSANRGLRIELLDLAIFPSKGENFFTSTADAEAYASIKIGYKYVFSETEAGFYVVPSIGYCRTVFAKEDEDATKGDGIAAALEGGYALAVGQKGNTINFGLKYEYDHGNATHIVQSVGFLVSYSYWLFKNTY